MFSNSKYPCKKREPQQPNTCLAHNGLVAQQERSLLGWTGADLLRKEGIRGTGVAKQMETKVLGVQEMNEVSHQGLGFHRKLRPSRKKLLLQEPEWAYFPEASFRNSTCAKHDLPSRRKFHMPPPPAGIHGAEPEKHVRGRGELLTTTNHFTRCRAFDMPLSPGAQCYRNPDGWPTDVKSNPDKHHNGQATSREDSFSIHQPQRDYARCQTPSGLRTATKPIQRQPRCGAQAEWRPASVRERIRQVVDDLESVLGGLKQVHREMKEVVQQIELLTSNIDFGEERPANNVPAQTVCRSDFGDVWLPIETPTGTHGSVRVDTVPRSPARSETAGPLPPARQDKLHAWSRPPPALIARGTPRRHVTQAYDCLAADPPAIERRSQTVARRPGSTQRPPPYPHNGHLQSNSKAKDPPETPSSPLKQRQLSTAV